MTLTAAPDRTPPVDHLGRPTTVWAPPWDTAAHLASVRAVELRAAHVAAHAENRERAVGAHRLAVAAHLVAQDAEVSARQAADAAYRQVMRTVGPLTA